jgi:hypothetical protein
MIHKARIVWAKRASRWRNSKARWYNFIPAGYLTPQYYSFFLIAFASFVEESDVAFSQSFSSWLDTRTEIWKYVSLALMIDIVITNISVSSQVTFLRKQYGSRLNAFAPVTDLSTLSKTGSATRSLLPGRKNDVAIAGGQILGDEYSDHVVKVSRFLF